jgi:hypothetical protein
MTIYSFENTVLKKIDRTTFSEEGILERQHLQRALREQIDIISPQSLVIAEEFSEWSNSNRRIDLLAIDKEARLVVIELKRNESGEHMELQAIRYASMISKLTFKKATEIYQKYLTANKIEKTASDEILEFLEWEEPQEEDFAYDTRIVLVSSNFSKEITTSVMWLNERNIDIRCVRLIPYKKENQLLVDVQQIIPLPEAESYQIKIRQKSNEQREAKQTQRDYTKYLFQGIEYNKRKLVLAVVQAWINDKNPRTINEIRNAFPESIRSKMFVELEAAQQTYDRGGISRHFLNESEIIEVENGDKFALSNQWGSGGNIERFIQCSMKHGYEIK